MSEKRYTVGLQSKTIFDMKTELYLFDNKIICEVLNAQNSLICGQQATINKLNDELELTANTKLYSRRELERKVDEQQNTIDILLECLYVAQDAVINEYSSNIAEDMENLDKIFEDKDIEEIRKFVLGVDEDEEDNDD